MYIVDLRPSATIFNIDTASPVLLFYNSCDDEQCVLIRSILCFPYVFYTVLHLKDGENNEGKGGIILTISLRTVTQTITSPERPFSSVCTHSSSKFLLNSPPCLDIWTWRLRFIKPPRLVVSPAGLGRCVDAICSNHLLTPTFSFALWKGYDWAGAVYLFHKMWESRRKTSLLT